MRFIFITSLLLFSHFIKAQVTIGGLIPPPQGAMLNLQESEGLGPTATKGLMLPRVNLTDRTKLYPMFNVDDPKYTGAQIEIENKLHTGLLVFNIKNDQSNIPTGLYIWDGEQWLMMGENNEPEIDDNIVEDHEGNDYLIGDFGEAGIWTLQNARPRTLPNKTVIPFSKKIDRENPDWEKLVRIYYPNGIKDIEIPPESHDDRKYGMLYSWQAATAEEGITGDNTPIRGICPEGWHIPTDNDWLKLEKEVYKNFKKYSNSNLENTGNWQSDWEGDYSEGSRGQFGKVLKSSTKVIRDDDPNEGSVDDPKGFSLPASEGGFDAYLVGGHVSGSDESQDDYNLHFGTVTQFWSRDSWQGADNKKTVRKLRNAETGVDRNYSNSKALFSVRCKKN